MSYEKNGKCWRVNFRYNGKMLHDPCATEELAAARDAAVKAEKKAGVFVPPHHLLSPAGSATDYGKGLTIGEMVERLFSDYAPYAWSPAVAQEHRSRYDYYIKPELGGERIGEVSVLRIEQFLAWCLTQPQMRNQNKLTGPASVEKVKQLLSDAFREAYRLQYISQEQSEVVKRARSVTYHSAEKVIWTLDEYVKALDVADERMRVYLRLSSEASQRIGEITGLKWDDVEIQPDLSAKLVFRWQLRRIPADAITDEMVDGVYRCTGDYKDYVVFAVLPERVTTKKAARKTKLVLCQMKTKGHEVPPPREVYIAPDLASELLAIRKHQQDMRRCLGDAYTDLGFVLAQDNGRPYEEHLMRDRLTELCNNAGITRITPHAMRHWSISFKVLIAGDDASALKTIQAETGQRNTQMVFNRYTHALDEGKKRMASAVGDAIKKLCESA